MQTMMNIYDLQKLQDTVRYLGQVFSQQFTKTDEYTLYIGPFGGGKSALLNFIFKNQLVFHKRKSNIFQIQNKSFQKKVPRIHHAMPCCILKSEIYQKNGKFSIQLYHWFQSNGYLSEIVNAFFDAYLLYKVKKVKIVLVFQISALLYMGGRCILQMLNTLIKVFQQDLQAIKDSILIVISKVNTDEWNLQTIKDSMKSSIKICQNQNLKSMELLRNIIAKNRIGIFPTPDKIKSHIQQIKQQLEDMNEAVLEHDANLSLTPKATVLLKQFEQILVERSAKLVLNYQKLLDQTYLSKTYPNSYNANTAVVSLNAIKYLTQSMFMGNKSELSYLLGHQNQLSIFRQILDMILEHAKIIKQVQKIDKQFNEHHKFIEQIQVHLTSALAHLEYKRQALSPQKYERVDEILKIRIHKHKQKNRTNNQIKYSEQTYMCINHLHLDKLSQLIQKKQYICLQLQELKKKEQGLNSKNKK